MRGWASGTYVKSIDGSAIDPSPRVYSMTPRFTTAAARVGAPRPEVTALPHSNRARRRLALAAIVPFLFSTASCQEDDPPSMSEAEPSPGGSGSQSPAEDAGNGGGGFGSGSSGDDAGLTPVPPQTGRFVVNSDGTVLDPSHQLIWTQHAPEPKTWIAARRYCTELELASGGYHLPTLAELKTIQEMQFGWGSAVHPNVFPSTPGNWFWTSNIAEKNSFDEDPIAGRLSFADVSGKTDYKSGDRVEAYVRCVKSVEPEPSRFEAQADGSVKDKETSLFWQPMRTDLGWMSLCTTSMCTQLQAAQTCWQISSGGGGWRLPTARQAAALLDARFAPAIRPEFFEGAETTKWAIWTSEFVTPESIAPRAYTVDLYSMRVSYDYADGFAEVLCVR